MIILLINKKQLTQTQLNFTLIGVKEPLTNDSNCDGIICFKTEEIQTFLDSYSNEIGFGFHLSVNDNIYILEILESEIKVMFRKSICKVN